MWGNIRGIVGKAIETAQKISSEIENELDASVGVDSLDRGTAHGDRDPGLREDKETDREVSESPPKQTSDVFFDDFGRFDSLEMKSSGASQASHLEESKRSSTARANRSPRPPATRDTGDSSTGTESEGDALHPVTSDLASREPKESSRPPEISSRDEKHASLKLTDSSEVSQSGEVTTPRPLTSSSSKSKKKSKKSRKPPTAPPPSMSVEEINVPQPPHFPESPKELPGESSHDTKAVVERPVPEYAEELQPAVASTSDDDRINIDLSSESVLEYHEADAGQVDERCVVHTVDTSAPEEQSNTEDSVLFFETSAMEISEYNATPEVSLLDEAITPIEYQDDCQREEEHSVANNVESDNATGIPMESEVVNGTESMSKEIQSKAKLQDLSRAMITQSEVEEMMKEMENRYAILLEELQATRVAEAEATKVELRTKESEALRLREELDQRVSEHQKLNEENISLRSSMDSSGLQISKLNEIIRERERALEVATTKMSEFNVQAENMRRKISDLQAEIEAKDAKITTLHSLSVGEMELKRRMEVLIEENTEKSQRLIAFEEEGKALALRQGEMEKSFRRMAKEVKDKDAEIAKLLEAKASSSKTIDQLQAEIKRHETEASSANKSLSAMQAVSSASNDRLVRLESELNLKIEELVSQKKALDTAWAENGDLKRMLSQALTERDEIKVRVDEELSKIQGAEDLRRQYEHRESVLRATSKQMQDSLQRQMEEASAREARLLAEVNEMRRRWQDAVSSRENMTEHIGDVTAPLLKQIASTQESLRAKTEQWQAIESALNERVIRAETLAEKADSRRKLLEEQLESCRESLLSCKQNLSGAHIALKKSEETCEIHVQHERRLSDLVKELEGKLLIEANARQALALQLRDVETKHVFEVQELKEALAAGSRQYETTVMQLKKEMSALREREEIGTKNVSRFSNQRENADRAETIGKSSSGTYTTNYLLRAFICLGYTPQGYVVESEKLRQLMQQQEERNLETKMQLQQLQVESHNHLRIYCA